MTTHTNPNIPTISREAHLLSLCSRAMDLLSRVEWCTETELAMFRTFDWEFATLRANAAPDAPRIITREAELYSLLVRTLGVLRSVSWGDENDETAHEVLVVDFERMLGVYR